MKPVTSLAPSQDGPARVITQVACPIPSFPPTPEGLTAYFNYLPTLPHDRELAAAMRLASGMDPATVAKTCEETHKANFDALAAYIPHLL